MALFEPYRALGFVSSHIPFWLQPKGSRHFVTTVVGDAYHIYDCAHLKLVSVGQVRRHDTTRHNEKKKEKKRKGKTVTDVFSPS